MDDEERALLHALESQRAHILHDLDGLSAEQLHTPMLPTRWPPIAVARHLTMDVERWWFSHIVAQRPGLDFGDNPNAGWTVTPGEDAQAILREYREEIARSNAIIAATDPADPLVHWSAAERPWAQFNGFRSVLLHVIGETAAHAGQLDAVRELIDGRTWLILTE